LHGRGRSPLEKVDLAARFGGLDGIRWMVPAADTGSWYPNRFFDGVPANEPFLSEAVARCHAAAIEASEGGRLGPERLVIAGFSQGACLALEYALRHPGVVGTLIVLTGGLVGAPSPHVRLSGLRVLLTGSDIDDWVPERYVLDTARVLTDLGAEVTLRMYRGRAHVVSEDEIEQAREMLRALLART
jgi:phospholipase/carboxylesterase